MSVIMDHTLALGKEGYLFIRNRCDQLNTDLFETKILGEKAICMYGEEATKLFYDTNKFERKNAAPKRIQKTLTGQNAIQGLDGAEHLHRKQLFTSILDESAKEVIAENLMTLWMASIDPWEKSEEIILFDEAKEKICEAACQWAGVPLTILGRREKADDFAAMVNGFGGVGPRHWKGRSARTRTEAWMQGIITDVRSGKLEVEEGTPLHAVAFHKDINGVFLDEKIAGIEMINIIRPIVATSTYVTFLALALCENPEWNERLRESGEEYYEMFVQEVRRFYPFTPFMAARVKQEFTWKGQMFPVGTLVVLDVYGTDHDQRIWKDPHVFRPERFENWDFQEFEFIPQGGGSRETGHRCPGEGVVVDLMKTTLDFLVNRIDYQVPAQDLSYSLSRIPALPESKFIINKVTRKA